MKDGVFYSSRYNKALLGKSDYHCYTYTAYPKDHAELKQNFIYLHISREKLLWFWVSKEKDHHAIHRELFELPLWETLADKDNLTSKIKALWDKLPNDDALKKYTDKSRVGYSSLDYWSNGDKKSIPTIRPRLFLDFLYDLERGCVFQNCPDIYAIEELLLKNAFVEAIHAKAEYYWVRKEWCENEESRMRLASEFSKAEQEWRNSINREQNNALSNQMERWFYDIESEVYEIVFWVVPNKEVSDKKNTAGEGRDNERCKIPNEEVSDKKNTTGEGRDNERYKSWDKILESERQVMESFSENAIRRGKAGELGQTDSEQETNAPVYGRAENKAVRDDFHAKAMIWFMKRYDLNTALLVWLKQYGIKTSVQWWAIGISTISVVVLLFGVMAKSGEYFWWVVLHPSVFFLALGLSSIQSYIGRGGYGNSPIRKVPARPATFINLWFLLHIIGLFILPICGLFNFLPTLVAITFSLFSFFFFFAMVSIWSKIFKLVKPCFYSAKY